jgi:hypothetical protein
MFCVVHSSRARNSMPGTEFQAVRQKRPIFLNGSDAYHVELAPDSRLQATLVRPTFRPAPLTALERSHCVATTAWER